METNEWIKKNNIIKNYAHFDRRVSIEKVFSEISNPENIKRHGFFPFLHNPIVFHKYSEQGRKDKVRQIYYSSHYDRCIYQYYSYLLNERYNDIAISNKINNVAIAYRTNLKKNNIHFAKETFDFIKSQKSCFIIVGDFKDFFDTLDHGYLKRQICSVLGVEVLPEDWYKVFKSITKYSYVNLSDILECYGLQNSKNDIKKLNSKDLIMPIQHLRKLNAEKDNDKKIIHKNINNFGIPQGSAISAVLSNIYMLDFDKRMTNYITSKKGKYLRYSDDTIFILPIDSEEQIKVIHNEIAELIKEIPNLVLQSEKTKLYYYTEGTLVNKDSILADRENDKGIIDYLGFSFDGRTISIRDKTIGKYYYRAYKKISTIVNCEGMTRTGKKISCKVLYRIYSLKGAKFKTGNFLSYAKRCEKIFGKGENVSKVIHTHYGKLKKRLNKREKK